MLATTACAVHALAVTDLQPAALEELKRAGILDAEVPVPPFRWTYENKRPMRHVRTVVEQFAAGPEGLSPVAREIRYSDGKIDRSDAISARGLFRVHPDDKSIDARFEGLHMPPKTGDRFTIVVARDGTPVLERCVAGDRVEAKTLHADIPGQALMIECAGDATYAGLKVRAKSKVAYLEALGMFFNIVDVLDTPLGRYENANRITEFQLVTP